MQRMLGHHVDARSHGRLEEVAELLNYAGLPATTSQVDQPRQLNDQRRGEKAVEAKEVDLDLHTAAEEADEVDVVPRLLGVSTRAVVVDADHVVLDGVA